MSGFISLSPARPGLPVPGARRRPRPRYCRVALFPSPRSQACGQMDGQADQAGIRNVAHDLCRKRREGRPGRIERSRSLSRFVITKAVYLAVSSVLAGTRRVFSLRARCCRAFVAIWQMICLRSKLELAQSKGTREHPRLQTRTEQKNAAAGGVSNLQFKTYNCVM